MPTTEQQLSLLGEAPQQPTSHRDEHIACAGGCGRERLRGDMVDTPDGLMCQRCHRDLYVICADCNKSIRLNNWGESSDRCIGYDGVCRCRSCHDTIYVYCIFCNRMVARGGDDARENPEHPENGNCICDRCWRDRWFECTSCGSIEDRDRLRNDHDDNDICCFCFDDAYLQCGQCGRTLLRGDISGWEGDPFCNNCYGNAEFWKTQPWSGEPGTFDQVGSTRRYGVEIETADCSGYRRLHGNTDWGCVYECSIPGREFVSPVLQGDNGFQEIRDFCNIAERKRWSVNSSCGLHIHLDIGKDSPEECLRIAYAYRKSYTLWKKFVTSERAGNSMCGSPQYTCADIRQYEHIEDFVEARDRFEFVNWRSYLRHGSFEVRLYHGSLNAREVCNWIALHARFMDAVKGMTYDEIDAKLGGNIRTHWPALCDLLGDFNLLDYWRRKAGRCGTELPKCWDVDIESVEDDGPVVEEVAEYARDSSHPGWSTTGECNCLSCMDIRARERSEVVEAVPPEPAPVDPAPREWRVARPDQAPRERRVARPDQAPREQRVAGPDLGVEWLSYVRWPPPDERNV